MKYKIIAAIFVSVVSLAWGAHDSYELIQQDARAQDRLCSHSPQLDRCIQRALAAEGVQYVFNGKHFEGKSTASYAANQ